MLDQIKALARGKNMCVLATDAGGRPHCSLMAYVIDENCREIFMVTHKNTQKYRNLINNPAVSLLIDSRENAPRSRVLALTVDGSFHLIEENAKRNRVKAMLLEEHPHLADFLNHAEAELLCVKVNSFLLLDGISEAHYQQM